MLQYSTPDRARRETLWRNGLAGAVGAGAGLADVDGAARALSEAEMNGREIANSINTARTLARDEGAHLSREHIETVVAVWQDFQEAIKSTGEWSA